MEVYGTYGVQDQINLGIGNASIENNSVFNLHAFDGDIVVGGQKNDYVVYSSTNASVASPKSRVSLGFGNDTAVTGAGNFNINLGANDDALGAGNGTGNSFVDAWGGSGKDLFTLGTLGDHDMLIRDLNRLEGDGWGFRTSNPISISFGQTTLQGFSVFTATLGDNTFYFSADTTNWAAIQASCLNTLI
jgi:hypothetical protein